MKNTQIKHQSRRAMETPRSQYLHPGHAAHVASGTLHETFDSFKFKPLLAKVQLRQAKSMSCTFKKKNQIKRRPKMIHCLGMPRLQLAADLRNL